MQIFTNGKRRFNSFMEYYVIHSKKTRGENLIIVPLKALNICEVLCFESPSFWRFKLNLGTTKICPKCFGTFEKQAPGPILNLKTM